MKMLLAMVAGLFILISPAQAELTRYEAVEALTKGTAVIQRWSTKMCTTWKAREKVFITAGHCKRTITDSVQIKRSTDFGYTYIKSYTVPVEEKSNGKKQDWLVLHTLSVMEDMVALPLGCGDEVKIGMSVAVGHYPSGLNFSVSFGHVMTMDVASGNAVIAMDAHAAPGSSGAPVINMETGRVIGILIEGLVSRFGAYAIGLESIDNVDLCDGLLQGEEEEIIYDTF